jgi:hypothetical protein
MLGTNLGTVLFGIYVGHVKGLQPLIVRLTAVWKTETKFIELIAILK